VKFTSTGWVRLSVAPLADEAEHVVLRFEVRDTGEGIAPDALPNVFEAFEQADSSTTRRYGGTGLGLALTRHIVRLMEGEVGVDSQAGAGSSFWFTARLRRSSSAGQDPAFTSFLGRRVLLVDDLPEALHALRDQLRTLGMQVSAHGNSRDALQAAAQASASGQVYDLLVLDSSMSPPDGSMLLGQLRSIEGLAVAQAVLVTARDDDVRQRAQVAGFDTVLIKPITSSVLQATLQRLRGSAGMPVRQASSPAHAEQLLRASLGGRRVLLAEDNPVNREVAFELLSAVGLSVEVAENGLQAVDKALAGHFDLLLMDMQMPELDGLDASRRLRSAGLNSLPIVAMTANAFGEDRAACMAAGMNDHLAKPVDPERLYATLLRWLPALPLPSSMASTVSTPARSVATTAPLQDRLAAIEGLDVAAALRRVGGREHVLHRVLDTFVKAYSNDIVPLDGEVAHALRGACATVGAVGVDAAVRVYEEARGRADEEETQRLADVAEQELRRLVGRLQAELGSPAG
jgi:two-component system sensor histidine kinase/response regulator